MPITTRTRIVENTWACLHCKATNKGRSLECSNCGAPKGSTIVDKIPEAGAARDAAEVKVGTALHATFSQGSNWACEYCKSQVRAPDGKCQECGGDKEKAKSILELRAPKTKPAAQVKPPTPAAKKEPVKSQETPSQSKVIGVNAKGGFRDNGFVLEVPNTRSSYNRDDDKEFQVKNLPWFNSEQRRILAIIASVVLFFIGFIWLMMYLFADHETNVVVQETRWTWTRQAQHDDQLHNTSWQDQMPPRVVPASVSCEDRIRNTFSCGPRDNTAHDCETHEVCTHVPDTCTHNPDQCTTVSVPETCYTTAVSCSESCRDNGNGSSSCTETCSGGDRVCSGGGTRQDCTPVPDTCTPNPDHCEMVTTCVCDNHENWCSYDYMEWRTKDQATASNTDHNVQPDPRIVVDQTDSRWRVVDDVNYRVKFHTSDNNWDYTPRSLTDYNRFNMGNHWLLRWNRAGTTILPLRRLP